MFVIGSVANHVAGVNGVALEVHRSASLNGPELGDLATHVSTLIIGYAPMRDIDLARGLGIPTSDTALSSIVVPPELWSRGGGVSHPVEKVLWGSSGTPWVPRGSPESPGRHGV